MNAQARDELRAEIIAFACEVNDIVDDDDAFVAAITAFFAGLANLYGYSPKAIRQHYTSEITAIGEDEYFWGFRPEFNQRDRISAARSASVIRFWSPVNCARRRHSALIARSSGRGLRPIATDNII